ncbi:MAG: hypothetical protein II888_05750 [Clostridia bacterium]|nr:hypothetical protein [Clostridia bacterium]
MEESYVRCLMVESGEEKVVLQLLRAAGLGRGIYPQRIRVRKIQGKWRQDTIRLLPGYVFVFAGEEIPIWRYQRLERVLKVLRYDREPDGYLRGQDLEFARTVQELDGKLDILNAVDEDGFIRVTDFLLEKLKGEVLSVSRRKREVKMKVNLVGQTKIITMNYRLVDGNGVPLSPTEDMLEDETDEWLTAWTPDFSEELLDRIDQEQEPGAGGEAPESIAPAGYYDGPEEEGPAEKRRKKTEKLTPGAEDGGTEDRKDQGEEGEEDQ